MEVYLQQQRFDRLRSLRVIARTVTLVALVVLVATVALFEWAVPSTPHLRGLIGAGFAAWLITLALDFLVHSHRLNSRMIMMRLLSARTEIDEVECHQPHHSLPRAATWVPPTARSTEELHAKKSRAEATLDESEHKVEQALLASTITALTGTLTIILGVTLSLSFAQ